jgi:hypothetical protein
LSKWYEILIASSITALTWMFLRLGEQPDGICKLFAFLGIAIIPTAYFQIRNTDTISKFKLLESVDDSEKMEKTPWFWTFALLLNTLLVGIASTILYLVYGFILSLLGYKPVSPF